MNLRDASRILFFTICILLTSACRALEIGFEPTPQAGAATVATNKQPLIISPLTTLVSVLPTATLSSPSATPRPTDVPTFTPSPAPTRTPEPTMLPTLTSQELSPEVIARMAVWRAAQNDAPYPLYQVSDTPLGVTSVEWSPGGADLWLNVATGPGGWGNFADTTSLVTSRETHAGWNPNERGDWFICYRSHDWSPDGKLIAYDQKDQVWLSSADGSNPHPLSLPQAIRGASSPKFSPDGKQLAMLGRSQTQSVYHDNVLIYDVPTETLQRVINDVGRGPLVWAPAGDALAMLSDEPGSAKFPIGAARLWIVDPIADSTIAVDLDELPGTEGCLAAPTWVLNGQKILASVRFRPGGIWLVDRSGLAERLGSRSEKNSGLRPAGLSAPSYAGPCYAAIPSPNGSYAVYMTGGNDILVRNLETNQDIVLGQGDLCYIQTRITWAPHEPQFLRWGDNLRGGQLPLDLIDAVDGSVTQLVANAYEPVWSPDGRRIAYWSNQADGLALSLLDLDTMKPVVLVSPALRDTELWRPYDYDTTPRWSADGKSIAFVSWRGNLPEAYVVQVP